MISKTSFVLAGKARRLFFPATMIFLLISSLIFNGGEVRAVTWQDQGPAPIHQGAVEIPPDNPTTGAIQAVLVDPNDNNTMYIGAVNGGIWKTTDGGSTWNPKTDMLPSLSMGGMALDQGNPNRILAGIGQFSNAIAGGPLRGVIFSSDAGNTWTSVGGAVTANTNVASVVVNGSLMFVASRSSTHPGSPNLSTPVTGLFRSTDDGQSFIQLSGSGGLPTGSVTSLASDPGNPNRLYAALQNSGIFRSDNQGKTWTNITPPHSGIREDTRYILLSAGAGGQSLFMGFTSGGLKTTVLQSVWRTLDQGATWQNMGGQGSGPGQGLPGTMENGAFVGINMDGQGETNFSLRADPLNPNIVYIAGDAQPAWNQINPDPTRPGFPNQIGANDTNASIFRGDASKALSSPPTVDNWTPATPHNGQWLPVTNNFAGSPPAIGGTTTHADSRSMTFDNLGNLLETNDGGVYRRSAPQSSNGLWSSLVGNLQITEIEGISYDSKTHTLISGNQDNGAGFQNLVNGKIWDLQLRADGGQTTVNDQHHNFSVRSISSQKLGNFTRFKVLPNNSILEAQVTKLMVPTPSGWMQLQDYDSAIPFEAPVQVNQHDKSMLAIGTNVVYLTRDNVSLNEPLRRELRLNPINPSNPFNLAAGTNPVIAYGRPGNPNLLLVATTDRVGHQSIPTLRLFTTLQPDPFTKLNYSGKNTITSVCINPSSDNVFYVADGSCLRTSADQGQSWITGLASPQLRALQFVSTPSISRGNFLVAGGYGTVYAARATDLDNWYSLKGNLPNTFVWEMDYSIPDDKLAVGTLGRGAFTVDQASTLMPVSTPPSVDRDWVRLLRLNPADQTLNGGALQNPDEVPLNINLNLQSLGGTFDTAGSDPKSGTNSTLTGLIAGPGSLTITGPGSLSLRHDNTYGGGTIFNDGTVNVERDANLGLAGGPLTFNGGTLQTAASFNSARDITLLPDGGTVATNTSTSLTLGGIIAGPGTLTKRGDGILTLSRLNTYRGGSLLNGGTLQVSHDNNLGAVGGPLTFNGGTLQAASALTISRTLVALGHSTFDTGTSASILNGELFGNGTFTQTGTGSLTLNGDGSPFAGTYAVSGGHFALNNALGSTLAPCKLFINPGSTLSGTGTGALVGTLDLQGSGSNYEGAYTVANGIFHLNNTLGGTPAPCTVTVNPDGLMTGTGTLVGTLSNRGSINPGNSPGTLSVVGSFAQTAAGTYTVEIASSSNYDKIAVTGTPGTANLAGTLAPVLLGGYQPLRNTVFPDVVTATGGITGTFSSLANQAISPTLFWQTSSNATSVDLVATPEFANADLPLTSNQRHVGTMLNSLSDINGGDLGQVLNAISQLPTGGAVADAYQQISPDKASALPALSLAGSMMQWQSVANRLTYQRWRQGGLPNLAGGRSGSFNLSYNSLAGMMLAYNGADLTGMTGSRRLQADGAGTWGLLTDFVSSFGTQDTTANLTGYNFAIFGFTLGADYRFREDLVFGLGTGYYNTSASYKGSGGDAGINSMPFYAYGAYTPGSFYAMGYLGYTLNLYSLNRNITFGTINRVATGSPNGNQLNVSLETGYDLNLAKVIVTPAFTLYYSTAWVDSFTENGAGSLNLKVGAQSADSVQTGIGMRLSRPFQSGTAILLPQIFAFYQHEFANNSRGLDARLAQTGNTFAFQTESPSRNFALLGAGLAAGLSQNLTLHANYNAEVGRGGYMPQVVSAGLRYEF